MSDENWLRGEDCKITFGDGSGVFRASIKWDFTMNNIPDYPAAPLERTDFPIEHSITFEVELTEDFLDVITEFEIESGGDILDARILNLTN